MVFNLVFTYKRYSFEECRNILKELEKILIKEPIIIERSERKALFIGDLHGDWSAFEKISKFIDIYKDHLVIFLGDYVDRGENSVEVFNQVAYYKLSDPDRFILLRGNHESVPINDYYGFKYELIKKFGQNDGNELYVLYNKVFSQLPVAISINDRKLIGIHGGIPINTSSIEHFRKIDKGQIEISDPILMQALWNDPNDLIDEYEPSPRGPGIYLFGRKIFRRFMNNSNAEMMIRAHTYIQQGFRYFFNKKLLSLFSVLSYTAGPVDGKIASYDNGKIRIINLGKKL